MNWPFTSKKLTCLAAISIAILSTTELGAQRSISGEPTGFSQQVEADAIEAGRKLNEIRQAWFHTWNNEVKELGSPLPDGAEVGLGIATLIPSWISRENLNVKSAGLGREGEIYVDLVDTRDGRLGRVSFRKPGVMPPDNMDSPQVTFLRHRQELTHEITSANAWELAQLVKDVAARQVLEGSTRMAVEALIKYLEALAWAKPVRLMSPVAFAQANLAKGVEVTQLLTGRGGIDLLRNPQELAKYKVGEFKGERIRGGQLTNIVYAVLLPGANDVRTEQHIIVRIAFVQPNDVVSYKYVDVGVMAKGGPNI